MEADDWPKKKKKKKKNLHHACRRCAAFVQLACTALLHTMFLKLLPASRSKKKENPTSCVAVFDMCWKQTLGKGCYL